MSPASNDSVSSALVSSLSHRYGTSSTDIELPSDTSEPDRVGKDSHRLNLDCLYRKSWTNESRE